MKDEDADNDKDKDDKKKDDDCEVEQNSGVEFPGESMEPLIGSALRMHQLNTNKNTIIAVEYKES